MHANSGPEAVDMGRMLVPYQPKGFQYQRSSFFSM